VYVLGVHRDAENPAVKAGEFVCCVREVEHLSGADEGEIEGVKEQDDPFSPVVG
jgi:hypothetical protein